MTARRRRSGALDEHIIQWRGPELNRICRGFVRIVAVRTWRNVEELVSRSAMC
jgi:hypothetical protein